MLKLYGRLYYNDLNKKNVVIEFCDLTGFYKYLKEITSGFSPVYGRCPVSLPIKRNHRIEINISNSPKPEHSGYRDLWIHKIENGKGIIFSDGHLTKGQTFCAEKLREWFIDTKDDIKNTDPVFVQL